jgi:hypothetical protein
MSLSHFVIKAVCMLTRPNFINSEFLSPPQSYKTHHPVHRRCYIQLLYIMVKLHCAYLLLSSQTHWNYYNIMYKQTLKDDLLIDSIAKFNILYQAKYSNIKIQTWIGSAINKIGIANLIIILFFCYYNIVVFYLFQTCII